MISPSLQADTRICLFFIRPSPGVEPLAHG